MTSPEVIKDLQEQKDDILKEQAAKRVKSITCKNRKKTSKKSKLNSDIEDQQCHVCQESWDDESTSIQNKWVVCDSPQCLKWACPRCLPEKFDYNKEYYCDTCTNSNF